MKSVGNFFYVSVPMLLLAGCGGEDAPIMDSSRGANETEESLSTNEKEVEQEETDSDEEDLSQYSTEQIEYARVWQQLGANQEIDGLYVQQIPEGTPLNPEDVIQLAGSCLVDGSVTYSGNGDGTDQSIQFTAALGRRVSGWSRFL